MIQKEDPPVVGPSCGSLSNTSQLVSTSSREEDTERATTSSGRPIQEARLSLSSVAMLQHYADLSDIPTVAEEADESEDQPSAHSFVMGAPVQQGSSPSSSSTIVERLQSSFMELSDGTCYGYLWKFSIGKHFFSRSNWKRRYFTLSQCDRKRKSLLRYFKSDTSRDVVGEVELDASTTRLVSRPSTLTHKQASCLGRDICLFFRSGDDGIEYRLLLRADTTEDHDRWVAAFRVHFDLFDLASDHGC